jgi:dsDNA-binding SOS-regulon protein
MGPAPADTRSHNQSSVSDRHTAQGNEKGAFTMAVITKYVVVRHGVELDKEFLVKKEADAYDKMLDAAENLAALIEDADLKLDIDRATIDAVTVFLAKNGPEVVRILKGLKPIVKPAPSPSRGPDNDENAPAGSPAANKKAPKAKAAPRRK